MNKAFRMFGGQRETCHWGRHEKRNAVAWYLEGMLLEISTTTVMNSCMYIHDDIDQKDFGLTEEISLV